MKEAKTALVLGGGGVRCMAHVGVFFELERQGLKPDLIVGSSIGSVLGGVYAYKNEAEFLLEFAERFSTNRVVRILERALSRDPQRKASKVMSFFSFTAGFIHSFWSQGFLSLDLLMRAYRDVAGKGVLHSRRFYVEDTLIPFAALATDMNTAEAVIITTGELPDAMYASSALPGVCKPHPYRGLSLADGGIVSIVPVLAAHILGAERIIAVDTDPKVRDIACKNSIEVIDHAATIRGLRWNELETSLADIVISPEGIRGYRFFEFSKTQVCLEAGRQAVQGCLPQIRELMQGEADRDKGSLRQALAGKYRYSIL